MEELFVKGSLAKTIATAPPEYFQKLTTLHLAANEIDFEELYFADITFPNLNTLHITGLTRHFPAWKCPKLKNMFFTTQDPPCTLTQLAYQYPTLKSLEFEVLHFAAGFTGNDYGELGWYDDGDWDKHCPKAFPQLKVLIMPPSSVHCFQDLAFPQLVELRVTAKRHMQFGVETLTLFAPNLRQLQLYVEEKCPWKIKGLSNLQRLYTKAIFELEIEDCPHLQVISCQRDEQHKISCKTPLKELKYLQYRSKMGRQKHDFAVGRMTEVHINRYGDERGDWSPLVDLESAEFMPDVQKSKTKQKNNKKKFSTTGDVEDEGENNHEGAYGESEEIRVKQANDDNEKKQQREISEAPKVNHSNSNTGSTDKSSNETNECSTTEHSYLSPKKRRNYIGDTGVFML